MSVLCVCLYWGAIALILSQYNLNVTSCVRAVNHTELLPTYLNNAGRLKYNLFRGQT